MQTVDCEALSKLETNVVLDARELTILENAIYVFKKNREEFGSLVCNDCWDAADILESRIRKLVAEAVKQTEGK